jgi:hypothetical protein
MVHSSTKEGTTTKETKSSNQPQIKEFGNESKEINGLSLTKQPSQENTRKDQKKTYQSTYSESGQRKTESISLNLL